MNDTIDVALVTWPNHPARLEYFTQMFGLLEEYLHASRHTLRYLCSAETQQDPDRQWMGDELEAYCREKGIRLTWRDAPANTGGNMNSALRLCESECILLQQDDWMLQCTLDLSPGAEFLSSHRHIDILRYSYPDNDRMRPTFIETPTEYRKIDLLGRWPYGDDPHLRRLDFMEKWGWYYDQGIHGTASSQLMRRLIAGGADIRVADKCYYLHGGPVTAVLNDVRNRRVKR